MDIDDLWDSRAVGRYLGLGAGDPTGAKGARAISAYRQMYDDFPEPLLTGAGYVLWHRTDIEGWRAKHPPAPRRKTDGS